MGQEKDEAVEAIKQKDLDKLKVMQEEVEYELTPLTERSLLALAFRRIPFMARFLPAARGAGGAIATIGEQVNSMRHSEINQAISRGFHFGSMALSALDFLRIPAMYIAAYVLGEKIPFTLNNNVRWLYSGVLLGLTLAAFLVPGAAPVIGLVAAGLALSDAIYTLGKMFYEGVQLRKERKQVKAAIIEAEAEMIELQEQAGYLEGLLKNATNREEILALREQVNLLHQEYDQQKQKLVALKNRELHVEQKIAKMDTMHVIDRAMGFSLAIFSTVAAVLAMAFPPLAAAMGVALLTTALTGAAYTLGRLIVPLVAPYFQRFGDWVKSKATSQPQPEEVKSEPDRLTHDSTLHMFQGLQITPEHLHILGDRQPSADEVENEGGFSPNLVTPAAGPPLSDKPDRVLDDKDEPRTGPQVR